MQLINNFEQLVNGVTLSGTISVFLTMNADLQRLYKYKVHHILAWIGYFAFFMTMYRAYYTSLLPLFGVTSVYFAFNASSFYIIGYYLIPKFLYTRKYSKFFWSVLGLLIVESVGLAIFMYYTFMSTSKEYADKPYMAIFMAFFSIITIAGIMCSIKLVVDKIGLDRSAKLIEQQRIESELQYLKAQVNPHFLFNAINSIYFLIKKDQDQAANTLIRLSDLLRFQLYDCTGEKIAIEKEIEYLRNFVSLEEIRKGNKTKVEFNTAENLQGFELAPFMLIPFLENTFKYVSNFSGTENKIIIKMWCEENVFHAHFFNTTDNLVRTSPGGIGHKNVKRRLELIYPEKHVLNIVERPGTYKVMLSLNVA
ncbi:histidine kinase [Cytophagales bacterium WSM2-2]|nr:histidine kinase [Cytophagales bacterium WSM2-2]